MLKMMKIELRRSFGSWKLYVAMLLGCLVTLSHNLFYVLPFIPNAEEYALLARIGALPPGVFNLWFSFNGVTPTAGIFYYSIPLLCATAFADSFYTDRRSGFLKNILTRTKKQNYFAAKYTATFLTGGAVVAVPLLVSLLVTALMVPSYMPSPVNGNSTIGSPAMWSALFMSSPYLYCLANILMSFVFLGLLSATALSVAFFVKNRFLVLLTPFLLFCCTQLGTSLLGPVADGFSPLSFLPATQYSPYPGSIHFSIILLELAVLFLLSFGIFFGRGIKSEVY